MKKHRVGQRWSVIIGLTMIVFAQLTGIGGCEWSKSGPQSTSSAGGSEGTGGTRQITGTLNSASLSISALTSAGKSSVAGATITCTAEDGTTFSCVTASDGKFVCECKVSPSKKYTCKGPNEGTLTFDADGKGTGTTEATLFPCGLGLAGSTAPIDLGSCDESGGTMTCTGNPLEQIDSNGDGINDAGDNAGSGGGGGPGVGCSGNADCVLPNPICDTSTGTCVDCLSDSDCGFGSPFCDAHKCQGCITDDQCSSMNRYERKCVDHFCHACRTDDDCAVPPSHGPKCTDNSCNY